MQFWRSRAPRVLHLSVPHSVELTWSSLAALCQGDQQQQRYCYAKSLDQRQLPFSQARWGWLLSSRGSDASNVIAGLPCTYPAGQPRPLFFTAFSFAYPLDGRGSLVLQICSTNMRCLYYMQRHAVRDPAVHLAMLNLSRLRTCLDRLSITT